MKRLDKRMALQTALLAAAGYAVVALPWILVSDHLLLLLASDDAGQLARLQNFKGAFFVAVTSLLLFLLVRHILVREAKVTRKARRLTKLIGRSPVVGMEWSSSPGWPVTFVSDNIRDWGYDPADLSTGRVNYADLIHPDDRQRIAAEVARHLAEGPDDYRQEYRLRHGDGSWLWIEDQTWLVRDPKEGVVLIQGVLMDVTSRVDDHMLEETRVDVLSDLVSGGSLEALLRSICVGLEALHPRWRAAILLRDQEQDRLRMGTAPSLPEPLVAAMVTSPSGPCMGAVMLGKPIYVDDLAQGGSDQAVVSAALEAGCHSCWVVPFRNGSGDVIGVLAAFGNESRLPSDREAGILIEFAGITGLAVDKTRSSQALQARERALETVAGMTPTLLRDDDTGASMDKVLGDLGVVSEADRVYVFEMHDAQPGGRSLCSQRYEWVREGITPQLHNPDLQNFDLRSVLPRWYEHLSRGEMIKGFVRDFPTGEHPWLQTQDIASVLVVPIPVEGRFWGFLGFDAVTRERAWGDVDEHVLRIVAASIGAAVERRRAAEDQRRAAAVIESTRDGVMITDLGPRIVSVNPAFTRITGYPQEEVVGRNPRFLQSGRHGPDFFRALWKSLAEVGYWRGEIWNRRRDGEAFPQWLSISRVLNEHGQPTHYTAVITDISDLKRTEERLKHVAHHDPLTDLPNRVLAQLRLKQAIAGARRSRSLVAVLFLDLDQFKTINDSLGHPMGDRLLVDVARRLTERVRDQDTLARFGGDEFLLIVEQLRDPEAAGHLAETLLKLLAEPFTIAGRELYVSASVGISVFPGDGDSETELIQHADAAMYQAKESSRNTYRFYTEELTRSANLRLSVEAKLRRALERDELLVHYQPQIDLATGTPTGVEALVRWRTADGHIVMPGEFIPIAEDSGLIIPIGYWVLHESCAQGRRWLDAGGPPIRLAVNLSVQQWGHRGLLEHIRETLDQTGFPSELLEFEITETTLMQGEGPESEVLAALRELGVRVAIDDFGTGYSSLSALKRFPVDVLKIDRAFVDGLPDDTDDQEIVSAIIAMARSLRLELVAEGVETPAQREFLVRKGCRVGQGFLFARPMPAAECMSWLRRTLAGDGSWPD